MFDHHFSKTVCLDADALLVSSEHEHAAHMATLAKSQGNFARPSEILTPQRCMTPYEFERFEQFRAMHLQSQNEGAFVVDISQSLERKRVGKFLPTACQSSRFFSFSKDQGRFFTPQDVMVSQGWHLPSCPKYGDLVSGEQLKSRTIATRVFGQGMHLAQVGQMFLFIISLTMRREVAMSLVPIDRPVVSAGAKAEDEE